MRLPLCAAAFLVVVAPSLARSAECTVAGATGNVGVADMMHEAQVAKSDQKVLSQEKEIMDALPKAGDTPIGKLMTPEQSERFGRLTTQGLAFYLDDMIESTLARDAEVVDLMYQASMAEHDGVPAPKMRNNAPLMLYAYLRFVATPKAEVQVPSTRPTGCSVDEALADQLYDAQVRINAFPSALLQASASTVNAIKAKYGSLDASKMSAADKEAVEAAQNAASPALRDLTLESDLQNIRDWWSIAQQVHDDRLLDIREYGADPKVLGNTEEAAYPKETSRQQMLLRSWDSLNAKMPSEHEVMMEQNAKLIDQLNGTHSSK